jgi:hypothetical protein
VAELDSGLVDSVGVLVMGWLLVPPPVAAAALPVESDGVDAIVAATAESDGVDAIVAATAESDGVDAIVAEPVDSDGIDVVVAAPVESDGGDAVVAVPFASDPFDPVVGVSLEPVVAGWPAESAVGVTAGWLPTEVSPIPEEPVPLPPKACSLFFSFWSSCFISCISASIG